MSNLNEIKDALNILCSGSISIDDITILHCNTDYPTKFLDVNLNAMIDIKIILMLMLDIVITH